MFIGLQSYTEAQSDIFYGRNEEIDRLTNLVKANALTIVFGKSGTGKTSLLNAGVFPRLRKEYCLPFRIRLEFGDESPDLVTQIKNVLKEEINKYGFSVEAYPSTETLWEYFHREPLWKSVTPILIFDQFEEIFTLGKKSDHFGANELALFWEELADLIENSIPEKLKDKFLNDKENVGYNYKIQKVKTLFSFREEFLPEFEGITAKIPSIKYSRFRLLPMNGAQAYEVVTKTWGHTINAGEAHKVVGFFAREDDKKETFDLMEIEPSLLSQVCSFIDKERMAGGNDKISAEFLDKYPKEKILHSIYNEVLAESNAVVPVSGVDITTTKPVNEFVEDKLITDEGYRTKYALTERDEKIRPGIEVLKAKYFLRDDGKSLELTHDVLTPLIKSDREERRKAIALAVARKKAARRSLFIVLFAVLAALLVWYLTANKAIQDTKEANQEKEVAIQEKNNAITKKAALDAVIKKDSVSLASLTKSLNKVVDSLNKLRNSNGDTAKGGDSTLYTALLLQIQNDSIELASLKKKYEDFAPQKEILEKSIALQTSQITSLTDSLERSVFNNRSAQREIAALQKKLSDESGSLALLQKNHKDLIKNYDDFIIQVTRREIPDDTANEGPHSDTASLQLNLKYTASKKGDASVPANLKIYLIPYNSSNKSIINNAQLYEIRCDEMNLDKAKDKRIARYKKGSYLFYDVPPGKYFVKICAYYGGYYTYTKKSFGNVAVDWEMSPPIR